MQRSGSPRGRRKFIKDLGEFGLAAVGGSHLLTSLAAHGETRGGGSSLLGGRFLIPGDDYQSFGYQGFANFKDNSLFRVDLLTNTIAQEKTKTPAHSTEPHPIERHLVACTAKRSDRVSMFDWRRKSEVSFYVPAEHEYFNGHSAFTRDGSALMVSGLSYAANRERPRGIMYVLKVPTLELVAKIDMGGFKAHDIAAIGTDDIYVCGLLGEKPGVANFGLIDFKKQSLTTHSKAIEGLTKYLSIAHIKKSGADNTVFGLGNVFVDKDLKAGTLLRFDTSTHDIKTDFKIGENKVETELLSIEFDEETGFVWMSLPVQNSVIVWDTKKGKVASVIEKWRSPFSLIQARAIDAIVIGTFDGLRAYDRKKITRLPQLDEKWSKLNLNGFSSAHTRIG